MSWTSYLKRTVPPVVAGAVVGGIGTKPSSAWYRGLDKPSWQPPAWLFGPVWTTLYALTAAGTARAMDAAADDDARRSLERRLWVNMALNAGWCWLFFTAQKPRLALAEILVLEASTVALARRAPEVVPYAAWNAFATALNAEIARRN